MFLGRDSEVKVLDEYLNRNGNQIMVMYGQIGVGKTTLIRHFMEDKENGLTFSASSFSEREQLFQWGNYLRNIGMNISEYPTYDELFEELNLRYRDSSEKIVIVFDEFQYLLKYSTNFCEALFSFLENTQHSFFIILCSSSIGWVENSMIKKLGMKAKNISGFFKLKELNFSEFIKYFKNFTFEECVIGYAILGGIPHIWEMMDQTISLEENIKNNILNTNHYLYHYGEYIVSRELRETSIYNTILCALASGKNKLNDLYNHTEFSRAKISVYIKNLMELNLVNKEFSYDTDGRNNTQKGVYDICNNYVDFTYQFIIPYQYEIENMNSNDFYSDKIKPFLKNYTTKYFSAICKEYLEVQNQLGKLPIHFVRIGKWIGKAGLIDFVAQDEKGNTMLGLCNWEKPMMRYNDYEWLLFCADQARLKPDYIYLFSAKAFDEKLKFAETSKKNIKLLTLDNL